MFKSFFPKPGPFFISAFIWALVAVVFWQAGGGAWVAQITGASGNVPISAARFWSLDYLIFMHTTFCALACLRCSGLSTVRTAGSTGRYSVPR